MVSTMITDTAYLTDKLVNTKDIKEFMEKQPHVVPTVSFYDPGVIRIIKPYL